MKRINCWLILTVFISCFSSALSAPDTDWIYRTSSGKSIDLSKLVPIGTTFVEKHIHEHQGCVFITIYLHKNLSDNHQADFNFEYIQRPEDETPILFFRDARSIDAILGNLRQLILINLHSCSNCNSVWIYDLKSGATWSINQETVQKYETKDPDWDTHGFPFGDHFSENDKTVLIHMAKNVSFEVDVFTGKILREND